MSDKSQPLLQIQDLVVQFSTLGGMVNAVSGVELEVGHGEIVGLIGESGCGKTTIAHAIQRVITTPPGITKGKILFDGTDLLGLSENEMRRIRGQKITMISQDPLSSLNPVFTVGEQMADSILQNISGRNGKRRWLQGKLIKKLFPDRALSLDDVTAESMRRLEAVELPSSQLLLQNHPHELSGGMRQRVLIAIASLSGQSLLIADEPTTSLDVTIQAQILILLRRLVNNRGLSVLYISHDLGVVAQFCDRVAVMYAGHIVEEANVTSIFREPIHPYTKALVQVTKLQAGEPLFEIPGEVPDLINPPKGCHFSPRCQEAIPECFDKEPVAVHVGERRIHKCGKVHGEWK